MPKSSRENLEKAVEQVISFALNSNLLHGNAVANYLHTVLYDGTHWCEALDKLGQVVAEPKPARPHIFDVPDSVQRAWLEQVYKRWSEWRSEDHADFATLSRHEICMLLDGAKYALDRTRRPTPHKQSELNPAPRTMGASGQHVPGAGGRRGDGYSESEQRGGAVPTQGRQSSYPVEACYVEQRTGDTGQQIVQCLTHHTQFLDETSAGWFCPGNILQRIVRLEELAFKAFEVKP